MKYILIFLVLFFPFISYAQSQQDYISQRWVQIAEQYGADRGVGFVIIGAESGFNPQAIGDDSHAHGLVQINDLFWPSVSIEQADDIDFSLNFLAQALVSGKCWEFSTCPLAKSLDM